MAKEKNRFWDMINIVYVITIVVSIALIISPLIPCIEGVLETILVSIGCSGIAAAVMSIFLDLRNMVREKRKKEQLRQVFLYGLYKELQHLFERVIWFDNVFEKLILDKDIDYYLSLDFIRDAHSCGYYKQTSIEECKQEIETIIEKYIDDNWKNQDDDTCNKIKKMFCIIGTASDLISTEKDIITRNQMYLVTSDILTINEIRDIHTYIDKFVELLKLQKANYGAALRFLFDGYLMLHNMCKFESHMFICWQTKKSGLEMVIDERKKEESIVETSKATIKESVNNKRNKRKKRK